MGTGSVESLVLKWLRRLPTVPVPLDEAAASREGGAVFRGCMMFAGLGRRGSGV